MLPQPKAVIFDLDGTLLNTIDDLADSCNFVLKGLHHPSHDTKAYFQFVGNGITKLASRILPETARTTEQISQCEQLIADHYDGNWKTKTRVYPGIQELLKSLIQQQIPLAVLSNKNERVVQEMVTHFLGNIPFTSIWGAIASAKKKPDPARALLLARNLQAQPAQTILIGDSKVDMQTAENGGMVGVGVTWGFRSTQELQDHGAKALIDQPMDFWSKVNP